MGETINQLVEKVLQSEKGRDLKNRCSDLAVILYHLAKAALNSMGRHKAERVLNNKAKSVLNNFVENAYQCREIEFKNNQIDLAINCLRLASELRDPAVIFEEFINRLLMRIFLPLNKYALEIANRAIEKPFLPYPLRIAYEILCVNGSKDSNYLLIAYENFTSLREIPKLGLSLREKYHKVRRCTLEDLLSIEPSFCENRTEVNEILKRQFENLSNLEAYHNLVLPIIFKAYNGAPIYFVNPRLILASVENKREIYVLSFLFSEIENVFVKAYGRAPSSARDLPVIENFY